MKHLQLVAFKLPEFATIMVIAKNALKISFGNFLLAKLTQLSGKLVNIIPISSIIRYY